VKDLKFSFLKERREKREIAYERGGKMNTAQPNTIHHTSECPFVFIVSSYFSFGTSTQLYYYRFYHIVKTISIYINIIFIILTFNNREKMSEISTKMKPLTWTVEGVVRNHRVCSAVEKKAGEHTLPRKIKSFFLGPTKM